MPICTPNFSWLGEWRWWMLITRRSCRVENFLVSRNILIRWNFAMSVLSFLSSTTLRLILEFGLFGMHRRGAGTMVVSTMAGLICCFVSFSNTSHTCLPVFGSMTKELGMVGGWIRRKNPNVEFLDEGPVDDLTQTLQQYSLQYPYSCCTPDDMGKVMRIQIPYADSCSFLLRNRIDMFHAFFVSGVGWVRSTLGYGTVYVIL